MMKGIHVVKAASGSTTRWYVYAYRGGPQLMIAEGGRRPRSLSRDALQKLAALQAPPAAITTSDLVRHYRTSIEWSRKSEQTRRVWSIRLDEIDARWGRVPAEVWDDPRMKQKVLTWRNEKQDQPRTADYRIQVLSGLLNWCKLYSLINLNVAEGIPQLYKTGQRSAVIWTTAEMTVWSTAAQPVADAVRLAALTGLRRTDLVLVGWTHVGDHAVVVTTSKGSRRAVVPIVPALRALLDELATRRRASGVDTLLVNSLGQGWTVDGLSTAFARERRRLFAGSSKTIHDFRGTYVTRLAEGGVPPEEIAQVVGWSLSDVKSVLRIYVDAAASTAAIGARLAVATGLERNSRVQEGA